MGPRFDPGNRRVELGVRDLLEGLVDRRFAFLPGDDREILAAGRALHVWYQERAQAEDPSFRSEVPAVRTIPHRGWTATIRGRADGVRRGRDGALRVEEVKSLRSPAAGERLRDLHRLQASLYAWLLAEDEAVPPQAELVWIDVASRAVRRETVPFDPSEIEAGLRGQLDRWIDGHERGEIETAARRAAAPRLRFPHPRIRPAQERIAAAVEAALDGREHLLVEAAPGIGKTAAVLHPALRHVLLHDLRLFVVTGKTLQQAMAVEVLSRLAADAPFHAVRLRAKRRLCATGHLVCHEDHCDHARDYAARRDGSRVLETLRGSSRLLLPDAIRAAGDAATLCPHALALDLAAGSPVVVTDYNHAFDPHARLAAFAPDADLSRTVLVIDEIHNLLDRGREMHGRSLGAEEARRAAAVAAAGGARVHREVEAWCEALAATIEAEVREALPGGGEAEAPLPREALDRLRTELGGLLEAYVGYRHDTRSFAADDPFLALATAFLAFVDGIEHAGPGFREAVAARGAEHRLELLCLDPAPRLGAVLARCHSVIGLSATLSPPAFWRDALGFPEARTGWVAVPAPFPRENRRIVIDPGVTTRWRERAGQAGRIAERLARFAGAVDGSCLALLPSFAFLEEVARRLPSGGKPVLLERASDTEADRREILDTLRRGAPPGRLLLAVAGGSLAEGVDYPGEMLRGVAVVGPCLPPPTLARELLAAHHAERGDDGFERAYVVPGMTRVVQSAGRLLRSERDRGVIALFGRRFLERPFRDHLPADWLDGAEPEALAGDPATAAAEFFG